LREHFIYTLVIEIEYLVEAVGLYIVKSWLQGLCIFH